MSLKHSACHTFRASEGSRKVFKMHLKSRKIDSMGDHISGKTQIMLISGVSFEGLPQTPFFVTLSGHMLQKSSLFGHSRDPFGSLRGTFGRLLVTKVPQRLPKVSQKLPNGSKASQKGSEKTTWLAFLEKFDVFSTLSSFCIVLASICFLLALIGSCWLLLAPVAFYLLLLPPIVSYYLLAAPIVSYCLLMAPLGS